MPKFLLAYHGGADAPRLLCPSSEPNAQALGRPGHWCVGGHAWGRTSTDPRHTSPDLVDSGMVTATVLAGRDGVSKPGRAAFELIAERLGVAVEDCYFIDDSEQNVDAAREFGMSAFHFLGDVAEVRRALVEAGALPEHDHTA